MIRKALRRGLVVLVAVGLVVFVVPWVSLVLDEGAVPAASDAPPLPEGVTVVGEDVHCGSGGCSRELTLGGIGDLSSEEVAADLGLEPGKWVCRARNLLDRRRVCSGVSHLARGVVLHLSFDRSF
jgi:hypothetical protein